MEIKIDLDFLRKIYNKLPYDNEERRMLSKEISETLRPYDHVLPIEDELDCDNCKWKNLLIQREREANDLRSILSMLLFQLEKSTTQANTILNELPSIKL
jgi:hypothetical protein